MSYKIYKIKKGKHSYFCLPRISLFKNIIEGIVIFNDTWRYDLKTNDHYDINKVLGMSDNWSFHHSHSARFGAVYNREKDQIDLFSYVYNKELEKEKAIYQFLASVPLFTPVTLKIKFTNSNYKFYINNKLFNVENRNVKFKSFGLKYRLEPYFGGNLSAPHDIYTTINWIKY